MSDCIKNGDKEFNRLLTGLIKERSKQEYKNERKENKYRDCKDKASHGQYPKIVERGDEAKTYK